MKTTTWVFVGLAVSVALVWWYFSGYRGSTGSGQYTSDFSDWFQTTDRYVASNTNLKAGPA